MRKKRFGIAAKPKKVPFTVSIPPNEFDQRRNDKKFVKALTLARHLNRLNFLLGVFSSESNKPESVSNRRQILHTSYYFAGVMHEALEFAPQLTHYFSESQIFKDHFARFVTEPYQELLEELLKASENKTGKAKFNEGVKTFVGRLKAYRDKIAFHVDSDLFELAMNSMSAEGRIFSLDSYIFVEGDSPSHGTWHYALAENLALNALIPRKEEDTAELEEYLTFHKTLMEFMKEFVMAGANLLQEYCEEMGWYQTPA